MPVKTRIERFCRGLEAAMRCKGIFHFCLHPDNLAESECGFGLFLEILERLVRARERGDIEVLTMGEVTDHMERQTVQCCVGRRPCVS